MRRGLISATLQVALMGVCSVALMAEKTTAQGTMGEATLETVLVPAKLVIPVYPALARQAQIGGDVELKLALRQDGTVKSAMVISGQFMLTEAALVSAQKSQFVCQNCGSGEGTTLMIYTFTPGRHLGVCTAASYALMQQGKSELSVIGGHVTIVAGPICATLDNVEISRKTRAVKCLYFWKCGFRQIKEK